MSCLERSIVKPEMIISPFEEICAYIFGVELDENTRG